MNIMRALGLCTYYLKSICISCCSVRSIVSLELLILLLGILLKNRSDFLSFFVGYRDLSPLYLAILSIVRSDG